MGRQKGHFRQVAQSRWALLICLLGLVFNLPWVVPEHFARGRWWMDLLGGWYKMNPDVGRMMFGAFLMLGAFWALTSLLDLWDAWREKRRRATPEGAAEPFIQSIQGILENLRGESNRVDNARADVGVSMENRCGRTKNGWPISVQRSGS